MNRTVTFFVFVVFLIFFFSTGVVGFETDFGGFKVIQGSPPSNTNIVLGPQQKTFVPTASLIALEDILQKNCRSKGAVINSSQKGMWFGPPDVDGYWIIFQCF